MKKRAKLRALRVPPPAPAAKEPWHLWLLSMAELVQQWPPTPPSAEWRGVAAVILRNEAARMWLEECSPPPGRARGPWLTKKQAELAYKYWQRNGFARGQLKAAVLRVLGAGVAEKKTVIRISKQVQLLRTQHEKAR